MTTPASSEAAAIAATLHQQEQPLPLQSPPERWLGGGGGDDLFWLLGYDLEVVKCVKGEQSKSWRSSNGVEGSTVIFKLCPSSSSPFSSYLKSDDSYDAEKYGDSYEVDKYDNSYDSSKSDDSYSTYYKSGDSYNSTMTSRSSSGYKKSGNSKNGSGSSSKNKSDKGCGYYSVGVNTFVYGYMDSTYGKNSDAYYQVYDYLTGCQLLQHASDHSDCDHGNGGYGSYWGSSYSYSYSSAAAWIGPTCTDDGTNIRLGTFSDPYCTAEIMVENVQNADKVPYTSTGIFPTYSDSGSEKMEKISCYHKNNYQYELSQACITPYQFACEKCETHVLKDFDGSSSGDAYGYDSYSEGDYGSSYGNSYGSYDGSYGGSSHTHTYDESYGDDRASGCDYLGHWVSGLSSKPTSFWSAGGGLSSFSAAAYGTTTSESRTAMAVLASVLATLGVVAMFVRRRERNTSNDAEAVETAFEIMKPGEFLEDSRASTLSAMKKARNGINIAAKTVVDLTRSNTLRAEDSINGDGRTEDSINGDGPDGRNVTFELGRVPMRSPGFGRSSLKPGMSPTHIWSSWVPPKDECGTSNQDGVEV